VKAGSDVLGSYLPRAWQAGTSWQGRGIWALEAVLAGGGAVVSLARARLLKPTLLMNARHHANEVSSTGAALRLAWKLGATPWGFKILSGVNVAIVRWRTRTGSPLSRISCRLRGSQAARRTLQRLGSEWYGDYFLKRPRFPEARVKRCCGGAGLPLLVLDAHGVPATSGTSPFSGYAPGRFRSFWIPRAFITRSCLLSTKFPPRPWAGRGKFPGLWPGQSGCSRHPKNWIAS